MPQPLWLGLRDQHGDARARLRGGHPSDVRGDELADHADDLADSTESEGILRLAEATDTAHRMM